MPLQVGGGRLVPEQGLSVPQRQRLRQERPPNPKMRLSEQGIVGPRLAALGPPPIPRPCPPDIARKGTRTVGSGGRTPPNVVNACRGRTRPKRM